MGKHAELHRDLPKSYPDFYATQGYKNSFYNRAIPANCKLPDGYRIPEYESDDLNDLMMVMSWQFIRQGNLTNDQCEAANSLETDEEANAHRCIMQERAPRTAVEWLNKEIDKFKLNDEMLMIDMVKRIKMARLNGWRAWCNWRQAKENDNMAPSKRLKLLNDVLDDCGFITGND